MNKESRVKHPWSDGEIQFLQSHYSKFSLQEIAVVLHRNYRGVTSKAVRLKLYKATVRNVRPINLKEIEKAYIAGFIDGEGSIGIRIGYKDGRPYSAKPAVEITNSNKAVIDWIGSKVNCNRWKRLSPYRKIESRYQASRWHYHLCIIGRLRVEPLLRTILPYLRIKASLAERCLEFYELHSFQNPTLEDWKRVLQVREMIDSQKLPHIRIRERLAQFIKELESKT